MTAFTQTDRAIQPSGAIADAFKSFASAIVAKYVKSRKAHASKQALASLSKERLRDIGMESMVIDQPFPSMRNHSINAVPW